MKEPMTEKQKQYIQEMQEHSIYSIPYFEGATKEEATEYIRKYAHLTHENLWAIENGYNF